MTHHHFVGLTAMAMLTGCAVRHPPETQAVADLSRQALESARDHGVLPGDPAMIAAADGAGSASRYLGPPPPDRALAFVPGAPPTLAEPGSLSKAEADALAAQLLAEAGKRADAEEQRRAAEARLKQIVADPVGELGLVLEGSGLPPWLQALLGTALTVGAGYFGLSARRKGAQASGLLGALVANGNDALTHVGRLACSLATGPDGSLDHAAITAEGEELKARFKANNGKFEPLIRKALGKEPK